MSALPERTVEAAARVNAGEGWWDRNPEAPELRHGYLADARATLAAVTDPALGSDRLVVAGPFEQEVIEKVCAWLEEVAATSVDGHVLRWAAKGARGYFGVACGRLMVGQGSDTYDPMCQLPTGHGGRCRARDDDDQRRSADVP